MIFASDTEAQNCPPLGGVPGEPVVWAWGSNSNGQLGNGTIGGNPSVKAVKVQNLSGFAAIAAGSNHNMVLKSDGTVWAWGSNSNGQLGDGTTGGSNGTPMPVQNLSGVTCIAAGWDFSLALKNDGTVWAWGSNSNGQLGDGSTNDRSTPMPVQNLSGVTAIAAGTSHSLAIKSDGTIRAWGSNGVGQLGDGTTIDRSTPAPVQNLNGVAAIAAGTSHSLAIKSDGTVWAWGSNGFGQLGDGSTHGSLKPIISNVSGVTAIAAGFAYSLALKADGTVWAWGSNMNGQLGNTQTGGSNVTPTLVSDVSGVTTIATKYEHSLAVITNGFVKAWGLNSSGQLGDGSTHDRPFAVQVGENLDGVTAIAAGLSHSLAAGTLLTELTLDKILEHPNVNRFLLFALKIDGAVVGLPVNAGRTGPQVVSPGNHTVSEQGGGDSTFLPRFTTVFGGDCAADGTVNLAPGDKKFCTITNYDHTGPCAFEKSCCEPGEGTQGCQMCRTLCP
jgi:alpha-tubulin suppressor-like RCC1 family protein